MITFRIAPHSIRNTKVVEVWDDTQMIGALYAALTGETHTLRIMSKHGIVTQHVTDSSSTTIDGVNEVRIWITQRSSPKNP